MSEAGPGKARQALGRLRVSRFELTIALALVVAATAPLGFAVYQAGQLTEHALAFGLDPRVVDRLESIPGLYLEIFRSRKQLYAEQARASSSSAKKRASIAKVHSRMPPCGSSTRAGASRHSPSASGSVASASARIAPPGASQTARRSRGVPATAAAR